MDNLISGANAKLAWAYGEDVEISIERTIVFSPLCGNFKLDVFDNPKNMFRLKPKTIKLELELPKPFEPKDGEKYWYLKLLGGKDYDWACVCGNENDSYFQRFGAWRTEDEIKQVVEQLRKIKGAV